jgi:hypothetical protein
MVFSQASAMVSTVCARWKAGHDALVKRLVLKRETTDEAVGMLVRRFPTVEYKRQWATRSMSKETLALSDKGVRAVSNLRALTHLDLSHSCG